MNKILLFFVVLILGLTKGYSAQTIIKGTVKAENGEILQFARVFLKATFDGANTNKLGEFNFKTKKSGTQSLIVRFIGFQEYSKEFIIDTNQKEYTFDVILIEEPRLINDIVISAGTFEASDEKKQTVLKPLDIVTTPGAQADVVKALQTLPGASRVGEQEGLFVRGGSASETKAVIDGMIVQNPFFPSAPGVAAQSRFPPFLFKGTAFSTGGYSAQYGQALSSVLVLNTSDLNDESNCVLGANPAGITTSRLQKFEKGTIAFGANYLNLQPALALNPQNFDWAKAPQGGGTYLVSAYKPDDNTLWKTYLNYSGSELGINFRNTENLSLLSPFGIKNNNFYSLSTFRTISGDWVIKGGVSYSTNIDNIGLDTGKVNRADERIQLRLSATNSFSKSVNFTIGSEVQNYSFINNINFNSFQTRLSFKEINPALFAETEILLLQNLASRIGVRAEYSNILNDYSIAPRASLAYILNNDEQISFAYGLFFQNPDPNYLYANRNLTFERADHYILNYQIIKNKRTFRIETYYKNYASLVRELVPSSLPYDPNNFRFPVFPSDNSGNGYAGGFDIFFRDEKSVEGLDYYVSYSYLDTRRLNRNLLFEITPAFAANHNFTSVIKYLVPIIDMNFGITYNYSSGRPYFNPNNDISNSKQYYTDRTPDFHNLSISLSKLLPVFGYTTVLYLALDNVTDRENVFGYFYSQNGQNRIPSSPPTFRSIFFGFVMFFRETKDN
jgi:hypothetical protein